MKNKKLFCEDEVKYYMKKSHLHSAILTLMSVKTIIDIYCSTDFLKKINSVEFIEGFIKEKLDILNKQLTDMEKK
jgi:hypothetical protein